MGKVKSLGLFTFASLLVLTFGLPAKATSYNEVTSEAISLSEGDEITGGTYSGPVYVSGGSIKSGTFTKTAQVFCSEGEISGGTFDCDISCSTPEFTISGGTFNNNVEISNSSITDGVFNKNVQVYILGTISGGIFNDFVRISDSGSISGGTFYKEVNADFGGIVDGGIFNNSLFVTGGTVNGGTINGILTAIPTSIYSNASVINGGTIETGGQLIVPVSSNADVNVPQITNLTCKSNALANIEGLPESAWKNVFSAASTSYNYVTLSVSPLRNMSVKNVRAGDYSKITLAYNANGGSGTMADTYAYVKGVFRLPKNTFTKNGTTFKGWSDKKTGPAKYKNEDDIASVEKTFGTSGTKTLYAIWADTPTGSDDKTDPDKPVDPSNPSDPSKPADPTAPTKPEDTTTKSPDGSATPVVVTPEKAADTVDSKLKTTSISKISSKKKTITVTWKKQTSGTNGYELQYSTNKKFENNTKSVTISKTKTTSKTIKKLKAGKKYYVRIRTYVNKGGNKVYSNWSKVKNVKVK